MTERIKRLGKSGNKFLVLDAIDGEPFSIVSRANSRSLALAYINRKRQQETSEVSYFLFEVKKIEEIKTNLEILNIKLID